MFKQDNYSDEIYSSMSKNLSSIRAEKQHNLTKIAKVMDYLQAAADNFDEAGMFEESKEITSIMDQILADIKNR